MGGVHDGLTDIEAVLHRPGINHNIVGIQLANVVQINHALDAPAL